MSVSLIVFQLILERILNERFYHGSSPPLVPALPNKLLDEQIMDLIQISDLDGFFSQNKAREVTLIELTTQSIELAFSKGC